MCYLRELFIPFANNLQGLFHGILGPTLLDIEQLTGTTTSQVSLMFTAMTVGALAGAPVGAYQTGKIPALGYISFKRVSVSKNRHLSVSHFKEWALKTSVLRTSLQNKTENVHFICTGRFYKPSDGHYLIQNIQFGENI